MIRSEAREKAFIIIFQKSINDEPIDALITMSEESDGIKVNQFATDLINGVYNNIDDIDKNIEKNLRDWTMGRISKTALAVLRLAAYEVLYSDDTPDGVAANEAVDMGK